MKKRRLKIPVRTIAVIIIWLIVIYIFFRFLSGLLWSTEYFKIKNVRINDKDIDLSFLLGKNIFAVDLDKEAHRISATHPNYQKITLGRHLPNCITVELKKREPVAYVRLYRYFVVDEEGVLFNLDNNVILDPNLPIISGLGTKIFGPKSGRKYYEVKELALSLDLIKEIGSIRGLKKIGIKKIDVSSLASLSFYIPDNIEIKIGESNINHKLRLLNSIFSQSGMNLTKVKYIDLRFKEPVIKYK
jgi:cell division septal protein FtsQ